MFLLVLFLVLTSMQAALFTAIVTAFVLDAMSDLDEDTATKLLRLLVEQSITNSTITIPPPNPPPSILTVNSLWLLSIVSSLAATTWAILCLQWCAFLSDGVQAEDYEEMAERRHRRFEAVKRWRMHLIVAAIPFFLHISLFLFLAGLWLRLRDMNKQLGLIVGVPSLVIASSYVVVTLLPIFTDAPFFTSVSELAQPAVDKIGRIFKRSRFIRAPRIFSLIPGVHSLLIFVLLLTALLLLLMSPILFLVVPGPLLVVPLGLFFGILFALRIFGASRVLRVLANIRASRILTILAILHTWMILNVPWIPNGLEVLLNIILNALRIINIFRILGVLRIPSLPVGSPAWTLVFLRISPYFPRVRTHHLITLPRRIRKITRRCIHGLRESIALLLPTIPAFGSDQNPFDELNKLKVGRSDRGEGVHLRALAWLMNTKMPLSKDEVKEILKEFRDRGDPGEPLDHINIRLFVLSLSSFLGDDHISDGEQSIFNYCATILAERMARAFGNGEYSQRTLFRNTTVSEKLSPHFHLTTPGSSRHPTTGHGEEYWARAIPALWLCPSTETIRGVTDQLNSKIQLMKPPHLQHIIRGLHAATLTCFASNQSTLDLIPDFSFWSWGSNSSDPGLDKALSAFLQSLFAAFYTTLPRSDNPITTPSLIVDCLKVLDDQPERYTLKLGNALCFFVAVVWRSNPKVFEEGPSVADALLKSAMSYGDDYRGQDDSKRATRLATRLRAIAYGPKHIISWRNCTLKGLHILRTLSPSFIKASRECLEGFIDAYAAILETVFTVERQFPIILWQFSPDYGIVRSIYPIPPTDDALFDFLREHPNYRLPYLYSLVIILLYTTAVRDQELWKVADLFVTGDEQEGMTVDRVLDTNILVVTVLRFALHDRPEAVGQGRFSELLRNITICGTDWRTRWKSIYLITDLVHLFSRIDDQFREYEQTVSLINAANSSMEGGELGRVPSDWETKKKGLALCNLETKIRDLVSAQGETNERVYEWGDRGNVPYLSLYNPPRAPTEPISSAAHWIATMIHR